MSLWFLRPETLPGLAPPLQFAPILAIRVDSPILAPDLLDHLPASVRPAADLNPRWYGNLGDDCPDRLGAFDADKLLVEAVVEIGQPIRIESELI